MLLKELVSDLISHSPRVKGTSQDRGLHDHFVHFLLFSAEMLLPRRPHQRGLTTALLRKLDSSGP